MSSAKSQKSTRRQGNTDEEKETEEEKEEGEVLSEASSTSEKHCPNCPRRCGTCYKMTRRGNVYGKRCMQSDEGTEPEKHQRGDSLVPDTRNQQPTNLMDNQGKQQLEDPLRSDQDQQNQQINFPDPKHSLEKQQLDLQNQQQTVPKQSPRKQQTEDPSRSDQDSQNRETNPSDPKKQHPVLSHSDQDSQKQQPLGSSKSKHSPNPKRNSVFTLNSWIIRGSLAVMMTVGVLFIIYFFTQPSQDLVSDVDHPVMNFLHRHMQAIVPTIDVVEDNNKDASLESASEFHFARLLAKFRLFHRPNECSSYGTGKRVLRFGVLITVCFFNFIATALLLLVLPPL